VKFERPARKLGSSKTIQKTKFRERAVIGIYGKGRPLHFQVSFIETPLTKIITIYEPDERQWV
jgi:hypothetical protein